MVTNEPLKNILERTQHIWGAPGIRPSVQHNLNKVLNCRTAALGYQIYASDEETKLVFHTCKSRSCPSCGNRATRLWQRDRWAALPDMPYRGIVFTMPDILWPLFAQNRHLLHDLPALGAKVLERWAQEIHGVRILIMVVPHTFSRNLSFNPHLHILVSAGGLREQDATWVPGLQFDKRILMKRWRYTLITFLRCALKHGVLNSGFSSSDIKAELTTQYERWWSIDVSRSMSKRHFLQYGGRYVRRPPIAQRRFVQISDTAVNFWTDDHKQGRILTRNTTVEFVHKLAAHVPDHYTHSIRYFGLLAPRTVNQVGHGLFALLGQKQRAKPVPLSWARSIQMEFGIDPLLDRAGIRMDLVGYVAAGVKTGAEQLHPMM